MAIVNYLGYEYCMKDKIDTMGKPETKDGKSLYLDFLEKDCENCQYECEYIKEFFSPYNLDLRRAFKARDGFYIVSMDYKAVEIRIAANMSKEPVWIKAFLNGEDVHRSTAKTVYKIEEPSDKQRSMAKICNFGSMYGGNEMTISKKLNIPIEEARTFYIQWQKSLSVFLDWVKKTQDFAMKTLYTKTFFGRRQPLGDWLASGDKYKISSGKRKAVNTPIQGSSADIIKLAMIKVDDYITTNKLQNDVRILTTVHDELDFEIRKEIIDDIIPELTKLMIIPVKGWEVPLEIDVEVSDHWGNVSDLEKFKTKILGKSSSKNEALIPIIGLELMSHHMMKEFTGYLQEVMGDESIVLRYESKDIPISVTDKKIVVAEIKNKFGGSVLN